MFYPGIFILTFFILAFLIVLVWCLRDRLELRRLILWTCWITSWLTVCDVHHCQVLVGLVPAPVHGSYRTKQNQATRTEFIEEFVLPACTCLMCVNFVVKSVRKAWPCFVLQHPVVICNLTMSFHWRDEMLYHKLNSLLDVRLQLEVKEISWSGIFLTHFLV